MPEWLGYFELEFGIRFVVNITALFAFLYLIYEKGPSSQVHKQAFLLFGTGVFLVTHLLHTVEMTMGFAFGLFAVFSMLRYRTESLSVRDMTYLFIVIAMSLISAVSPLNGYEQGLVLGFICVLAWGVETSVVTQKLESKLVLYEKIENIKPENHQSLIQDLNDRLGLNIHKADVEDVDFLKDTAQVRVYFDRSNSESSSANRDK